MIDSVPVATVAFLVMAAFAAGWIDSVAGGGGVIQLPALLIGLPSTEVATLSGTNKLSSVAGTSMATATYLRKVSVRWALAVPIMAIAFVGSLAGASLVQYIPRVAFTPLVAIAVAGVGVYTWRHPAVGTRASDAPLTRRQWALALALTAVVGVWDGLVGPGTGIFFVLGFATILKYSFLQSTTLAKLGNLTTNVAAIIILGTSGHILWILGGCMAIANLAGGGLGARMALAKGNSFVRRIFLVVVVITEIKLVWDTVSLAMT